MAKWTEKEIDFVLNNYGRFNAKEISKIINKSSHAVYSKIQELKNKGSDDMKYSYARLNDMMNYCDVSNSIMRSKTRIDEKKILEFRQGKKIPTFLEAIKMAQVLKCSVSDFTNTSQKL